MDPSADIINTMGRLYDINSLASVGIGDVTLANIYQTAASSTLIPTILDLVRIVSFLACVLLVLAIVTIAMKMRALNSAPKPSREAVVIEEVMEAAEPAPASVPAPAPGGWLAARWGEITRHMESAKEAEWRFAIIEADKMVDEVLKRAGYPGSTLGERLMNIQPGQLETLDGLWYAHKIRNRVAHDMNYFLRYTEAKQTIGFFEATLREFRAV